MRIKPLLKFIVAIKFVAAALLASSFADASEDIWTACGNQGENCDIPTQDRVLVRYGNLDKNNYFFFGVEGVSAVTCSNFIGNPSDGDSKQCWYNEDSSSIANGDWQQCADQGGTCTVPGNQPPLWVKYGAGDKWLYTVQSGAFTCDNDHFGWNPDDGTTKSCWVGYPVIYSTPAVWNTCATESNTCDLTGTKYSNTGIIIRYGVGDAWNYKIATQSGSFDCNNDNFGNPDNGPSKSCGITSYLESAVITEGKWNEVVTCRGANCDTSFTVTWGSTWSDSVTNQQTWSSSVTESVSEGITIPPETVKSSIGYSESYANSSTYQQSLSDTFTESLTVTCDNGPGGPDDYKVIYQFATASSANCLTGTGQCSSNTYTQDYICYTGDAEDAPTPQCLPNACKDTYCTVCLTD